MSGIVDLYGKPYRHQDHTTKSTGVKRRLVASVREERLRALFSGFRSVSAHTPLYLMPQDHLIILSYWMYFTNDIIGGMIEKKTDIIIGDGFSYKPKDSKIYKAIEYYWDHPTNDIDWNQDIWSSEISVFGEYLASIIRNPYSDNIQLYVREPFEIERTITDPMNRKQVIGVKLKADFTDPQILRTIYDPRYPEEEIFSKEAREMRETFTTIDGPMDCVYFAFNPRVVDDGDRDYGPCLRGTPDLLASFDPASDAEEVLFSMRRRADVASRILWDVTYEGASKNDIQDFNDETPLPDEYTINTHNERIRWQMISPDLKASEHETQFRLIRNHTISGKGGGMPPTWFGDGTDANRASAKEMPFPTIKGLKRRQRKIMRILYLPLCLQLDAKNLPYTKEDVGLVSPTIDEEDLEQLANAFARLTSTITIGEDRTYITTDEARQSYRNSLQKTSGIEFGEYEEPPEDEQRVTEDYKRLQGLPISKDKEGEEEGEEDEEKQALQAALERSPSGSIPAKERKKKGIKQGPSAGKFPIGDRESALSAINLRHNAKPPLTKDELDNLLRRAAEYAPEEAKTAREKDKKDEYL